MAGAMKSVCTDTNMSHLTANAAIDKNSSDTNVHAGNLLFGTNNKMKENDNPIPWKNGNYFTFPILQPIQQVSKNFSSKSGSSTAVPSEKVDGITLCPWEQSAGAIVVQVKFDNVLNNLSIFDDVATLGQVVIPISEFFGVLEQDRGDQSCESNCIPEKKKKPCHEMECFGWFPLSEGSRVDSATAVRNHQSSKHSKRKGYTQQIDDTRNQGGNAHTGMNSQSQRGMEIDEENNDGSYRNDISAVNEIPAIYLRASLSLTPKNHACKQSYSNYGISERIPHAPSKSFITGNTRETSKAVAVEMIRAVSASMHGGGSMIQMGSSTINTIQQIRGMGGQIQNQVGDALDFVESLKNLFMWASPSKSLLMYVIIILIWVALCFIPGRILIFCAGMGIFVSNFLTAFNILSEAEPNNNADSPFIIWFTNLFSCLPTDEDLRRTYFWETRQIDEHERHNLAQAKRAARLNRLWNARWYGAVRMKVAVPSTNIQQQNNGALTISGGVEGDTIARKKREWKWESVFVVIQGHRIVWWKNERAFDDGDATPPLGQILFAGHSGIAGLSPLDIRQLDDVTEVMRTLHIFGRGSQEQQKIALLAANEQEKEAIEDAVIAATMDEKVN